MTARFTQDLAAWLPWLTGSAQGRAHQKGSLSREELLAVTRAVRSLSKGFTRERDLAGTRYFNDVTFLKAYLLYYWPISYIQARLVYARFLPPEFLKRAVVLDLGSGPGPAALAALDAGADRVTAADRNREAVKIAGKLAAARGKRLTPVSWNGTPAGLLAGRYDLVVLSHVVNELYPGHPARIERRATLLRKVSGLLSARGRLVLIEPALLSTTRELLALRDRLLEQGFRVCAPCFRQGPCPCLTEPTATCHAQFSWEAPAVLKRIAHGARLGGEHLRFSFLVLRPGHTAGSAAERKGAADEKAPVPYRVVSEKMLSKSGRRRYFLCGETGRFTLSAKPDPEAPWTRVFSSLERYDAVRLTNPEQRAHGLGLTRKSELLRVDATGE